MDALRSRDDPWRRLPWVAPLALLVTILSQMLFLSLLQQSSGVTAVPVRVDVQVVELPAAVREPEPPPVRKAEPPPPKPPPPRPKPPEPTPSPPPKAEPEVAPPPEPVRSPVADLPKMESPPPAPSAPAAPSPVVPSTPSAPAASPPAGPPATAALTPRPPVAGTPGGTGLGGGTMGARAIYKPLPEIPEALRHRNIDVVAVARFRVAPSGAAEVDLIEPTGDPDLNRALLESLRRWRFFPGLQDGKPVASTVDIRIPISVK